MTKKEEIIEATFLLFSEKGYNTTVEDISQAVKLKPQSLYSHFDEYSGSGYTGSPVVGNRNSGEMETGIPVAETAC